MIKNVAILGVGVIIGYYLLKPNKTVNSALKTVNSGDKSKDVEGMQKAFEKIANLKFETYGQYDADTLAAVQYLLRGTSGLIDSESGAINASLVNDISKIYYNSLKS